MGTDLHDFTNKKFSLSKKAMGFCELHKSGDGREPLARVPYDQTIHRIVWSPLLSFGILRISPIAMGEEGLRPSTPQAFEKA